MTEIKPPSDFIADESSVEGIEIYKPAPVVEEERPVVDFECPQCGATTAFGVAEGGLTCTHCGYYEPPEKPIAGKGAEELEFKVETLERAAHGWGEERKELECENCGAITSLPQGDLTLTCPFCASNKVIQRQANQDALRPRFVIPFKLEAEAVRKAVEEWLGSSWMTPGSLRRLADLERMTAIYLPFWTFDAATTADWRAQVGHTQTERYRSGGEWKTRTVTVWRWESGHVDLRFDDLLVDGTTRVSDVLLNRVKQFDLNQLAPYEPKYLAGFHAHSYDVELEKAWDTARAQMRESTRQACRSQASTRKIRSFSMNLDFSNETWRYILVPAYLAPYAYRDNNYQVVVNAQTGAIAGQRPADWAKIAVVLGAAFVPGAIAALLGLIPGLQIAMLVGFGLLAIAVVIAIVVVIQALRLDDV
jgi:DNA-directed RNA polymerase subunit RPC12/RpoP